MNAKQKTLLGLILIGLVIMLMPSCKVVDISGQQTVQKRYKVFHKEKVSIVKLKGLKGTFVFPTDTLKTNSIVNLKKIKP